MGRDHRCERTERAVFCCKSSLADRMVLDAGRNKILVMAPPILKTRWRFPDKASWGSGVKVGVQWKEGYGEEEDVP